jgi:hypothetical protein
MNAQHDDKRGPIVLGCLGAALTGLLSLCVLVGVAGGAFTGETVPSPPVANPTQPDITVVVEEAYIRRALTEALPASGEASLDIQPDNRLVVTARFDLMLVDLDVIARLRLLVESGELDVVVESIEAGGQDILGLIGMNGDELARTMGAALQQQIEAGLGEGAQLLDLVTDDDHITFTARWAP